jgi:hypothetical protein
LVACTWYRRLTLAEYRISYAHYGISLIAALVLAKIVMIGNIFGPGRKREDRPSAFPTSSSADEGAYGRGTTDPSCHGADEFRHLHSVQNQSL